MPPFEGVNEGLDSSAIVSAAVRRRLSSPDPLARTLERADSALQV
jgi:hypothetical protein